MTLKHGKLPMDKYIKVDTSKAPNQRYLVKTVENMWIQTGARNLCEARDHALQHNKVALQPAVPPIVDVPANTSRIAPYGTRPDVDPVIICIEASEFGGTVDHYVVVTPYSTTFINNGLDGARGYAYRVYVQGRINFPPDLEPRKAEYREKFILNHKK